MKQRIQTKRVYEPPSQGDGARILVDRIWPRGLRKDSASLDLWLKNIAPSASLRKWYDHKPERWPEFRRRYEIELADHKAELEQLIGFARRDAITLLYAARDGAHCNAEVLRQYLGRQIGKMH